MNYRISLSALLFTFFCSMAAFAQVSDKEKFTEALYLMDERRFSAALPILQKLQEKEEYQDNANVNYNIGVAMINAFDDKQQSQALPYLQKAAQNVSPNYRPFSHREDRAPVDAHYYLGKAQHNNYQFKQAAESFKKFKTYINDKHYLYHEIDNLISMADYAESAVENPVNIELNNLGGQLNSFFPDYSPVLRIDESAIYFTSRRLREDSSNAGIFDPVDGMYYEDIYVAFNDNGNWGNPIPLNINTDQHEATLNLSVDGQTLYIYKDIEGNGELFKSEIIGDSAGIEIWSEPEKLGSNINTKAYETHVTISPDEKTLYFISDREGGFGGKDIYYCRLLPNGMWAMAQNVGPRLNSKHDEDGVFMHPDGKTLYFSSNGHESMGGYDIMFSTLTDTGWSEPENMGYPINSVEDDVFFVTTPDGKRAYFSSFKEDGYGEKDIYMIKLIDAEEIPLTLYKGVFTFADRNQPPPGAVVTILNNETGELVGTYTPRQRDGQFSVILESNNSYHLIYEADNYRTYEEDIYVPYGTNYQEIYKEIQLKPVLVGVGTESITAAGVAKANVNGRISVKGKPLTQTEIRLLDKDRQLLESTTTDGTGSFNFQSLDPSSSYLLEVNADGDPPLLGYDITLTNNKGEELTFEKIDDSTYLFVPSLSPYEYYGIKAKSLSGQVKYAGETVEGLKIRLENQGKETISSAITDKDGRFSFEKLDLDNEYRLVFEGDFPDDPEIIVTNDIGERMRFVKETEGIYRYVPTQADRPTQIAGRATIDGVPISGMSVNLKNSNGEVIQQSITDENGNFVFSRLDMDQNYLIEFDGDIPDNATLVLKDEHGNLLTFEKVGPGLYEYKAADKKESNQLAGIASRNGAPISGVEVTLLNSKGQEITKRSTDENGLFVFDDLNMSESYRLVFDEQFPEDGDIALSDESGNKLMFVKIERGVYEYYPAHLPSPMAKNLYSDIEGEVNSQGEAVTELKVLLLDGNRNVLKSAATDSVGKFNFLQLNLTNTYFIQFEGNYPEDAKLVVANDNFDLLLFRKIESGLYKFDPLFNVKLVNKQRQILSEEITDDVSNFDYRKLNKDEVYLLVFGEKNPDLKEITLTNEKGEELIFKQISKGIYEYTPDYKFSFKPFTVNVDGDFSDTYPSPEELEGVITYFQRYFKYNAKDINESNTSFVGFINQVAEIVKVRGYADIIITSSASKVPTSSWKSNSELSKKRAYDTRDLLIKVMKRKGITSSQYNFVDVNTLITGPEYNNDARSNRPTYEKHQYVRIFIK